MLANLFKRDDTGPAIPPTTWPSARAARLLYDDSAGVEDGFGPGERLRRLARAGEVYIFAKNNGVLQPLDNRSAGNSEAFI